MIEKTEDKLIPKKLHAIWVGGILRDAGKNNIAAWKKLNPEYEANVWIDSSTYLVGDSPEAKKQKEEYLQFKKWAKDNKINILDINPNSTEKDPYVIKRPTMFEGMKSAKYYADELKDPGSNYAAASDILRVEILYHEGGVYFDAEDIFPNQSRYHKGTHILGSSLGQLTAKQGLLVRSIDNEKFICNDLIASIPKGELIGEYRDRIKENYDDLYSKGQKHVTAHRIGYLATFRTKDRKKSTLEISGPTALNRLVPEHKELAFSNRYWTTPEKQAGSWLNKDFESLEKVAANYRYNVIEYFDLLIEEASAENNENQALLNRFKNEINANAPPITMFHLVERCKQVFSQEEIEQINRSTDNVFSSFENYSAQAEEFFLYCMHADLNAMDVYGFVFKFLEEPSVIKSQINALHQGISEGFFGFIKEYASRGSPLYKSAFPKEIENRKDPSYKIVLSERQEKITEQVQADLAKLRLEGQKALVNETANHTITNDMSSAALVDKSVQDTRLYKEHLKSAKQTEQTKNHINLTYLYGENGSDRYHLISVNHGGYKGDVAKRKILELYKEEIEGCSSIRELNTMLEGMLTSKEFEILKTPQGVAASLLELKTSSVESLEDMLKEAITHIREKNTSNGIQDDELISLDGQLDVTLPDETKPIMK